MGFDEYFPAGFSLETHKVLLRPMEAQDSEQFLAITQSDFLWKYFAKELNDKVELQSWMDEALHDRATGKRVSVYHH